MVKRNKKTSNAAASKMFTEMRGLITSLFGKLNARQDRLDETISELKKSIESSKAQEKGGKEGEKSTMDASSVDSQEENANGHGKALIAAEPNENQDEGLYLLCDKKSGDGSKCRYKSQVCLIDDDDEDDVDDFPAVDPVTTVEKEAAMKISLDAVVDYSEPYEGFCVTGYYGKRPLTVLIGMEKTSHNFINESLANKLGCETFPIKPRTVRSAFGTKVVTSRACNNFQLSLQGTVFNLNVYLLPLSSNCDMILGSEWLGTLEKVIISAEGAEIYFQGKKQFVRFNQPIGGSKRLESC